ncbi:MAG TPA: tRNA lysidine(34) synthetase TilS [Planctomycetes bacterium]|nr:tRNA lysidine(34) synthetase TilS [Planctomycetota bacterium]HIK59996.1 tRNA lysidine(34) synthetase TilS [Planctomycetota bacterium]
MTAKGWCPTPGPTFRGTPTPSSTLPSHQAPSPSQPDDAALWREAWAARWHSLAKTVGLNPREPLVLALSGGADSVYLLHLVAAARMQSSVDGDGPHPKVLAVHVDHMLRGEESCEDSAFCARMCARLSVPFARRRADLGDEVANLEARARKLRYGLLAEEALGAGSHVILTGHHEDDALETLLLRWMRGSSLPGLAGLKAENIIRPASATSQPMRVVRPLLNLRREEVRHLLREAGVDWREDSSNGSPAHTRNRVRNQLLPRIESTCGPTGVENLRAFASAVEGLEDELATRTANLNWDSDGPTGRQIPRDSLDMAHTLQRRALWRLLSEGTGRPPSHTLLSILQEDLENEVQTRHTLPGGWHLDLAEDTLVLTAPGAQA